MMFESLSKNKLAYLKSLQQSKFRQKYRKFVVEGYKSVSEFLKYKIFTVESIIFSDNEIQVNTDIPKDKIFHCKSSEMEQISNLVQPTTILAVFDMIDYTFADCLSDKGPILLLDGIQDPGNCGTIIRTADWFGLKSIIRTPQTADFYHPKVVQATMGSLNNIKFSTMVDLDQLTKSRKTIVGDRKSVV